MPSAAQKAEVKLELWTPTPETKSFYKAGVCPGMAEWNQDPEEASRKLKMDAFRECQPSEASHPTSYHHHSLKLTFARVNRFGGKMSLSQYQTALAAAPRQLPALLSVAVPGLRVTSTTSSDGGRPGKGHSQWLRMWLLS